MASPLTARPEAPFLFTVAEMLDHFMYDRGPGTPSLDDLQTATGRLGRTLSPSFLLGIHENGLLSHDAAEVLVPGAWNGAEHPMDELDPDDWGSLFRYAGYTHDGVRRVRPRKVKRLFRGADYANRDGWSWTEDLALATWFAERESVYKSAAVPDHPHGYGQRHTDGRVWVADVEPDRLLARITEARPGETEWVVETDGLVITEHVPA